jgi:hypothetical protein
MRFGGSVLGGGGLWRRRGMSRGTGVVGRGEVGDGISLTKHSRLFFF